MHGKKLFFGCTAIWLALGHAAFAGEAGPAEAAFKQHCKECHRSAAAVARSFIGNTPDERMASAKTLLEGHHAPDPSVRDLIAGYLVSLADPR